MAIRNANLMSAAVPSMGETEFMVRTHRRLLVLVEDQRDIVRMTRVTPIRGRFADVRRNEMAGHR